VDSFLIDGITQIVLAALIVVPLWRIFAKAGKNPALSLFVFVPFFGVILVSLLLAFSRWPTSQKSDNGGA